MGSFKTLDNENVAKKRILMRADLNVPMSSGKVTDTTRIDRTVPGVRALCEKQAKVVIISHFGRPKGSRVPELSLKPVSEALSRALGKQVHFVDHCVGPQAFAAVQAMKDGDVVMLENLRFHGEEEKNDPAFAEQLAELGDIYVNDAFSCAHRAHASTHAIAKLLPAFAGYLMQEELQALEKALENPERPVVAVVGGAKISTKMSVLENLAKKVDRLIIGGGMANTFLRAQGISVGKSLCEHEMLDQARSVVAMMREHHCEILLPVDVVVAKKFEEGAKTRNVSLEEVMDDDMILDIGPMTVDVLKKCLEKSKTILWNGPMGAFEIAPFDKGTVQLAQEAALLTRQGRLLSVAGGGDTVAALTCAGVVHDFSYVSTAGGAFLEWIEGKELPGVAVLSKI